MAGYHCHTRLFGAELWNDPWLSQNSLRREVMRAMIHLADGFGKMYDSPELAARIKIMFFPIDDTFTGDHIRAVVMELTTKGAICCYTVDDEDYVHLPSWKKYQQIAPTRRGRSNIPDCPRHGSTFKGVDSGVNTDPPASNSGDPTPDPQQEPTTARTASTPRKKKPYTASAEAVKCYDAWHARTPVPDPKKINGYCKVFDDMHSIDGLEWQDIYAILDHAVTVWVPNGWLESPMKLRRLSRDYPDMKTWQLIQAKMEKAGQAQVDDTAVLTLPPDAGMDAALKNMAA